MLKHVKVKHKIMIMLLLALSALLLLFFVSQVFTGRNNELLTHIETSFVPALELSHALEKTLTDIQRSMQDAVAAADEDELAIAETFYTEFLQLFENGRTNPFFEAGHLDALKAEFQEYFALARQTSRYLIEGGSLDGQTVQDLQLMNEGYNAIKDDLKFLTNQAKDGVSTAFAATVKNQRNSAIVMNAIIFCCAIFLGGFSLLLGRSITTPLHEAIQVANQFAEGKRHMRIPVRSSDVIGGLGRAFNAMMSTIEKQDWFKTGLAELNISMRGEQDVDALAQHVISYLAIYLDAQIGAICVADEDLSLRLIASYAGNQRKGHRNSFKPGEGLIGQAALEKQSIVFRDVPDDYMKISSGLGEVTPRNIFVVPFVYGDSVQGVIELGSVHRFTEAQMDFLNHACESIAIAFHSARSRVKMQQLLGETQKQSEKLQVQQKKLQQVNEELEAKAQSLKASEEELQTHQQELRRTNKDLKEQTRSLEEQKQALGEKNRELEKARKLIEEKARDLERSGKYKSEFLANMSHELRTPLNSLLILARLLSENKNGNLTEKQVEYARTIHVAGADLLELINEILDLSKVEAGKMALNIEEMSLKGLVSYVEQTFTPVAEEKGLALKIELTDGLPACIRTDRQRVEQIVKNLLSNALKFTSEGEVRVHIARPPAESDGPLYNAVAISVSDTGIGINEDKQRLIFEAFQQADGSTSRKYGGTGLGLSIVRELTKLLGGEIHLRSEEGKGCTFTLYLSENPPAMSGEEHKIPRARDETRDAGQEAGDSSSLVSPPGIEGVERIWDDRHTPSPTDRFLLIIEDDPKFAKILFDLAREKGFKGLIAGDGAAGLQLTYQYTPHAIILDVGLPGMDGWMVMEKLKNNPDTHHIPVHFISVYDQSHEAVKLGATGYLTKPLTLEKLHAAFDTIEHVLSETIKKLLIVEHDEPTRQGLFELLSGADVDIMTAQTGAAAYTLLKTGEFDCLVLDLDLADISGFELLEKIRSDAAMSHLPIIVCTVKDLTKEEEIRLEKQAERIIIKGVQSQERLVDEVTLFLHRVEADLPETQQQQLRMIHGKEAVLRERTILIVDDDMRNVFALSSILEENGMHVLVGEHGKKAMELLDQHPKVDLVLMDIMMPEMDGYEAMRRIRKQPRFKNLPIIALTAKAMKGDRQKCLDAGANDYLSKPVDTDKLLSLLQVWLY